MVKVKICGITNLEDALGAVEYGADMVGFIFAPSPRKVDPQTVKDIVDKLPSSMIKVGVFMDEELDKVKDTVSFCGLDMAQLHGDETPEFCAALSSKVIKTFTPQSLTSFDLLKNYSVDAFMLDKQKGTDTLSEQLWPIAKQMGTHGPVILAGALTPANVTKAINAAHPYAVDVASGVEKEPGKKDHQKMQDFIRKCKGSKF
ncbi:MAG: phosphoribosylanthranilate isomerase [Chloroflexi bacterium]|nr:phosphoribosylanthranilate isomerase [Chloroflexota bacterium]